MLVQQIKTFNEKCGLLLNDEQIRFVGIVNNLGNLIAGGFKDGINPFESEDKRRMMYMQMVLEISMRKEFDSSLGPINYIASSRGRTLMISIPLDENLLLISAKPVVSTEKIVTKALGIFQMVQGDKKVV